MGRTHIKCTHKRAKRKCRFEGDNGPKVCIPDRRMGPQTLCQCQQVKDSLQWTRPVNDSWWWTSTTTKVGAGNRPVFEPLGVDTVLSLGLSLVYPRGLDLSRDTITGRGSWEERVPVLPLLPLDSYATASNAWSCPHLGICVCSGIHRNTGGCQAFSAVWTAILGRLVNVREQCQPFQLSSTSHSGIIAERYEAPDEILQNLSRTSFVIAQHTSPAGSTRHFFELLAFATAFIRGKPKLTHLISGIF